MLDDWKADKIIMTQEIQSSCKTFFFIFCNLKRGRGEPYQLHVHFYNVFIYLYIYLCYGYMAFHSILSKLLNTCIRVGRQSWVWGRAWEEGQLGQKISADDISASRGPLIGVSPPESGRAAKTGLGEEGWSISLLGSFSEDFWKQGGGGWWVSASLPAAALATPPLCCVFDRSFGCCG